MAISNEGDVAIGGDGDAKGIIGGVVGGIRCWPVWELDINDVQTVLAISNEGDVAIGREGDVTNKCVGDLELASQ